MNFTNLGAHLGLAEDEYRDLIALFIQSCGDDLMNLQDALTTGNADQVMRRAHTIRGASGNLGLTDVSAAARIIEEQAKDNHLEGLEETLRCLRNQFETIRTWVH